MLFMYLTGTHCTKKKVIIFIIFLQFSKHLEAVGEMCSGKNVF